MPVSEDMSIVKLCPFRKIKYTVEWNESTTGQAIAEDFLACCKDECSMWDGQGCSMCRINMVVNPTILTNKPAEQEQKQQQTETTDTNDLLKTTIKVIEAKEINNPEKPGVIRAWCEINGGKSAVFAKNGVGKDLLDSIGKEIEISYRVLENDKGKSYFAVKVNK